MVEKQIRIIEAVALFTKKSKEDIFDLFSLGVMNESQAFKYVVKNEFWNLLKTSDITTRSAIIDVSIKWGVDESYVKRIIYKTPNIK